MEDTKQFDTYVQKWVLVDNEIHSLQEKLKKWKEMKQTLSSKIKQIMEEKQWTGKVLDIPDGTLKLTTKREYSSLSFGYLEECLESFVPDPVNRDILLDYIRDHREVKETSELKRFTDQK
jgi:hypothetical protein